MKPLFRIKRVYNKPLKNDGYRVLVDRLWPRAISVENAAVDLWAKDLAPSVTLRKWFGHDPELWTEFQKKYKYELKKNKHIDEFIEKCTSKRKVTLLYGAHDEDHNHALVLREYLQSIVDTV